MHIRLKQYMSLKIRYVLLVFLTGAGIAILFAVEHKDHVLESEELYVSPKNTITLFLDGGYEDYLEFIRDQPKEKRLEWKQFQEIHEIGKKVEKELDDQKISEIIAILQLNLEESFATLKKSKIIQENEALFEAAFFIYTIDSFKNASKEEYADLLRVKKAISLLKSGSEKEAFDFYKTKIANLLELDTGSILHRYLLKEALKRRIYSIPEIQKVKAELLALPSEEMCKRLSLNSEKVSEVIHAEHGEEAHH